MNEQQVQNIIERTLQSNQFRGSKIPFHIHDGVDSPKIKASNLIGSFNWTSLSGIQERPVIRTLDGSITLTVSTSPNSYVMPYNGQILSLGATTDTSGSGNTVIDIKKNGTSILSTKITIASGATTSRTNGTQPIISSNTFSIGDILTFNVISIPTGGGATVPKGLSIFLNTIINP